MGRSGTGRSLKTARAVLRVLRFMASQPLGVRTEEVAQFLDKSAATASYLLNSLCQEGYALREPDGRYRLIERDSRSGAPSGHALREAGPRPGDAVDELYGRTAQRSYLATLGEHAMVVQEARGRQGLPKIPDLTPNISAEAHALALGKALLAFGPADALETYVDAFGLGRFTPFTSTDQEALAAELEHVRQVGYAVDREEFAPGFCCVAAPVLDGSGELLGALALSVTAGRFAVQAPALIEAVTDVAAVAGGALPPPPPQRSVPTRHQRPRPLAVLT